MPLDTEMYLETTREKTGTLKRQPEWKAAGNAVVTRNA